MPISSAPCNNSNLLTSPRFRQFSVRLRDPGCKVLVQGDFDLTSASDVDSVSAFCRSDPSSDLSPKIVKPDGHPSATAYLSSLSLRDQMVTQDPEDPRVLTTRVRRLRCHVCRMGFTSLEDVTRHRGTLKHRRNFCYQMWQEKK